MQTSVLVGNGFDLSVGLRTSPQDFIPAFVEYAKSSEASPDAKNLAATISADGIDEWSSFEEKMGEFSTEFDVSSTDSYQAETAVLTRFLGIWLEKQQELVDDEFIKENARDCMLSLAKWREQLPALQQNQITNLRSLHSNEHWAFDLISFNYTNTLERLYRLVGGEGTELSSLNGGFKMELGKFIYAHEKLPGPIVCGVNDESQISNEMFRDSPSIVRNLVKGNIQREVLYSDNDSKAGDAIKVSCMAMVFGMSIGVTDKRWWHSLVSRLREDANYLLIIFAHDLAEAFQSADPLSRDRITQGLRDRLLGLSGFEEIDDAVRERIFVVPCEVLFPISKKVGESVSAEMGGDR